MAIAAIVLAILVAALGSAIVLSRRWNAAIGILGGLAIGIICWASISAAMFYWFVVG
jgi:hypothetical protein